MATFRAMNTDVTVIADAPGAPAAVERVFADAERTFSRFRDDSELARINRAIGPIAVSPAMFATLVAARRYVELTGGLFDPAIGGTLAALGYDRSFAPGALDRETAAAAPVSPSFLTVALDAVRGTVTRPANVQIDLGGIVKGRTVDAAAVHLPACGAIDAGGDAIVRGADWPIEIEDPRDPARTIAIVTLRDRAVATSAATRRRWRVGRALRHHLVDPRTRRSAVTDVLQATVFAPTAELADVLAKTLFLLGTRAACAFVGRFTGVGAVLVPATGAPVLCGEVPS